MGSPGYLAPEQFIDPNDVDVRTDIFSLGTIVYEMLAGKPAFKGKDGNLLLSSTHIETVIPLSEERPDLPPGVCDAVMRALEKEPEDRFDNVPQFVETLYRDVETVSPPSVQHLTTVRRWNPPETLTSDSFDSAAHAVSRPSEAPKSARSKGGLWMFAIVASFMFFSTLVIGVVVLFALNDTGSVSSEAVSSEAPSEPVVVPTKEVPRPEETTTAAAQPMPTTAPEPAELE